jgi:hypothetical protein
MVGQMPIPSGRMISAKNLSETELADLRQIPGWKPGDPIPAELAEMMSQINAERDLANLRPPVPEDTPPLTVAEPVEMSQLPPEKQAQLQAFMASAQQNAGKILDFDGGVSAPPGVADAIAGRNVLQLDDDRPAPPTEPPARRDDLGLGGLTITNCPHCNWQLDVADIQEPTALDRQAYLQAILGTKRFEKTYDLFGGHVQITLRELRPRDVDAIYLAASRLLTADDANDAMRAAKFMEWVDRYRLALQMVRFRVGEQALNYPPTLEDWKSLDTQDDAALVQVAADKIFTTAVTTESLGRALMATLSAFCQLVAKLEVSADRPDFWTAAPST